MSLTRCSNAALTMVSLRVSLFHSRHHCGDPRNHWPSPCSLIEQLRFLLRVSDVEGFANYDDVLGYLQ